MWASPKGNIHIVMNIKVLQISRVTKSFIIKLILCAQRYAASNLFPNHNTVSIVCSVRSPLKSAFILRNFLALLYTA